MVWKERGRLNSPLSLGREGQEGRRQESRLPLLRHPDGSSWLGAGAAKGTEMGELLTLHMVTPKGTIKDDGDI